MNVTPLSLLCSESALSRKVPTQTSQPQTSALDVLFLIIMKWSSAFLFRKTFLFWSWVCIDLNVTWKCFNLHTLLTLIFSLCFYVCAVFHRRSIRFGSDLFYFLLLNLRSFFWTHCFRSILRLLLPNTNLSSLKVSNSLPQVFSLDILVVSLLWITFNL